MRPDDDVRTDLRADLGSDLGDALKALADADRGLEAGSAVEARLAAAFKRKHKRSIWPAMLAIAATAILGIGVGYYRSGSVDVTQKASAPAVTPAKVSAPLPQPAETPVTTVARVAKPVRKPAAQLQEIATDFFPLVDYAPPSDETELVRVNLPASAMREVGLPVREEQMADRVQADVVMSNGMATAIRFVKFSQ